MSLSQAERQAVALANHRQHIEALRGKLLPQRAESTALPAAPSLLRKAGNFAVAVGQHMAGGLRKVSDEQQAERLLKCQACVGPGGFYDADRQECAHPSCGCNMRVKTWWAEQACPIGKWAAIPLPTVSPLNPEGVTVNSQAAPAPGSMFPGSPSPAPEGRQ